MDENEARQVSHDGESDSFLDGWEETGPVQEETDPGGDGGKQAGEQEEDRADPGEDSQGGEDGQPGGEGDEGEKPESQPSGGQRPFPPRNRAQIRADIQAFAAAFPEAAGNVGSIPREGVGRGERRGQPDRRIRPLQRSPGGGQGGGGGSGTAAGPA